VLVISGADLTGKTTFATECVRLLQELGWSHMLHHLSRPPASWDYHKNYVERMCVASVWDRFHLDSLAYRQCDEHPCSMTPLKWDLIEAEFRLRCGFQVILLASPEQIEARHKERGDNMYDLEHIQRVNLAFIQMCNDLPTRVRDEDYCLRISTAGGVTPGVRVNSCIWQLLTPKAVVDAYEKQLREFQQLSKQ
jgi:hypothetical protein